jgi:hypothetical protein
MTFVFPDLPTATLLETAPYTVSELPNLRSIERSALLVRNALIYSPAASLRQVALRGYFREALRKWREGTQLSSLLEDKRAHPAYRRIVDMGEDVIPLILEEIKARPDLIFMALHDITGEDPITPEHRGRVREMIQDWLRWESERRMAD